LREQKKSTCANTCSNWFDNPKQDCKLKPRSTVENIAEIGSKKQPSEGASLDTFSLTGHKTPPTPQKDHSKSLEKRARSKWYTQKISGSLLYTNSKLHKYYQRAYYCNHTLTQKGGKIIGKYCNTRICNVCNRIRTAKLIDGYLSQLTDKNLQFVTLTLPNVDKDELRLTIEKMQKDWRNMLRVFRTRRSKPINGIRKLEITYNGIRDDYHPHFHLLVDGQGEQIITEWLLRNQNSLRKAQDVRDADKGSMMELFKYTTKILASDNKKIVVYTDALDVIMRSMYRKRAFQPFGNIRKVSEDVDDELDAQEVESYEIIEWEWHEAGDWVDVDTGECLTGYVPPENEIDYR